MSLEAFDASYPMNPTADLEFARGGIAFFLVLELGEHHFEVHDLGHSFSDLAVAPGCLLLVALPLLVQIARVQGVRVELLLRCLDVLTQLLSHPDQPCLRLMPSLCRLCRLGCRLQDFVSIGHICLPCLFPHLQLVLLRLERLFRLSLLLLDLLHESLDLCDLVLAILVPGLDQVYFRHHLRPVFLPDFLFLPLLGQLPLQFHELGVDGHDLVREPLSLIEPLFADRGDRVLQLLCLGLLLRLPLRHLLSQQHQPLLPTFHLLPPLANAESLFGVVGGEIVGLILLRGW